MDFLSNEADIILFGGGAGGGKTYGILLDVLWFHDIAGYTAIIFRRNSTHIRAPGGLWDNSQELFRHFGGVPNESTLEWNFPSGAVIKFAHLQYEKDVYQYQGTALCGIYWDEATHFSDFQFWYMFSRNRSMCGIKPYQKLTCNPDADSWVRNLVDWYIDTETGLSIPERSGIIRWFIRIDDSIKWASTKEELQNKYPTSLPKSFSYIPASVFDNKKLLEADPGYLANLHALSRVERERLLHGNWNVKSTAGLYFKKEYFEIVDAIPPTRQKIRYWDRASTKKTENNDPDYTVGIKIEKDLNNILYVTDMVRIQESPLQVQNIIKNTAIRDGISVKIGIEEDPGQAGVADAEHLTRLLQGFSVKRNRVMKDKVTRASPVSAQAEAGNIKVLRAKWNDDFFKELENFPEGNHDDIVDSLSGAFLLINSDTYSLAAMAR
ncbi:MAG: phage terminase large subunit [Thermoplasmatales archaeon]